MREPRSVADLAAEGVRSVNRQKGSGTRDWFDRMLTQTGLSSTAIRGDASEAFTHPAGAAVIACGSADAGRRRTARSRRHDPRLGDRHSRGEPLPRPSGARRPDRRGPGACRPHIGRARLRDGSGLTEGATGSGRGLPDPALAPDVAQPAFPEPDCTGTSRMVQGGSDAAVRRDFREAPVEESWKQAQSIAGFGRKKIR